MYLIDLMMSFYPMLAALLLHPCAVKTIRLKS